MADYSTTVRGIPILFAGGCWARRQLHAGIRYVPVTSKLMKLLSSIEVVLGSPGEILLDSRFLHNHCRYSNSDCGRLLGSTSASRRYKVRLCRIKTQDLAGLSGGETYEVPWRNFTRWLIPPQPLEVFQFCLREVVGLDVSYTPV